MLEIPVQNDAAAKKAQSPAEMFLFSERRALTIAGKSRHKKNKGFTARINANE